ncbi:MAG: biotin transporter BioY [Actinobacteria bacterium]|nr:biotin transporter BioY [Actinomycetota bacterium]
MSRLTLREMVLVAFFAALTVVGAWISFPLPFSPVPITLANLFAVLSGAILGKKRGTLSQLVYLLLGFAGVPVFAGFTSGPGIFAGATGGYLVGYVLAAFIAGVLVEYLPRRLPPVARLSVAFTAAAAAVYLPGIAWLSHVTGLSAPVALVKGLYPFLPGDALKIIVAVVLCRSLMQVPRVWRSMAKEGIVRHAEME